VREASDKTDNVTQ
jgi:hypothetical protein